MDYAENGDLEKYLEKRKIENKPLKYFLFNFRED
jgi:hypothetical protein